MLKIDFVRGFPERVVAVNAYSGVRQKKSFRATLSLKALVPVVDNKLTSIILDELRFSH